MLILNSREGNAQLQGLAENENKNESVINLKLFIHGSVICIRIII